MLSKRQVSKEYNPCVFFKLKSERNETQGIVMHTDEEAKLYFECPGAGTHKIEKSGLPCEVAGLLRAGQSGGRAQAGPMVLVKLWFSIAHSPVRLHYRISFII